MTEADYMIVAKNLGLDPLTVMRDMTPGELRDVLALTRKGKKK